MKQYTYDLFTLTVLSKEGIESFVEFMDDLMDKRTQSNWQIKDITTFTDKQGDIVCAITWEQDY